MNSETPSVYASYPVPTRYIGDLLFRGKPHLPDHVGELLEEGVAELLQHFALLEVVALDLEDEFLLEGAVELSQHFVHVLGLGRVLLLVDVLQVAADPQLQIEPHLVPHHEVVDQRDRPPVQDLALVHVLQHHPDVAHDE